jgi:hypothetical protein
MHLTLPLSIAVFTLTFALACVPKVPETGDTEATTDTSSGAPGTASTEATGTTGDTTGGASACAVDPTTSAMFRVLLDAWPDQTDEAHSIDSECTVDAVESDGITVTTSLTCDVDGVPLGAKVEVAAAPEGEVDWAAGAAVALRSHASGDEFGGDVRLRMVLSGKPEALLIDGQDWWGDNVSLSEEIGPIHRERTNTCTVADPDAKLFEWTYSLMSGATVTIPSGHRGALEIDATHAYAIDLQNSSEDCCHGSERILIRQVQTG